MGIQYMFDVGKSICGKITRLIAYIYNTRLYWLLDIGGEIVQRIPPVEVRKMFPEVHDVIFRMVAACNLYDNPTYSWKIIRLKGFDEVEPTPGLIDEKWLVD